MNRVTEQKRAFTEKLSMLAQEADSSIKGIEYKCIPSKYSELLRIYYNGSERIINVTGNSLLSIFVEVARELNGQDAIGAITDPKHAELIKKWWLEDGEDPKIKNQHESRA